ncbi:hypothetical protein BH11MYX3_BH11MYX3_11720 [soil metagenome]
MSDPLAPSEELRALLDAKLDTLEKLEIVLALRDAPENTSTVEKLAHHLQVGPSVLAVVVEEIKRAGVVSMTGDDVTLMLDGAHTPLLAEAELLYKRRPSDFIRLFSTIAMHRIRRMAARSFSDAFQLRKKKGGDHG